jgi:hypothetical protein
MVNVELHSLEIKFVDFHIKGFNYDECRSGGRQLGTSEPSWLLLGDREKPRNGSGYILTCSQQSGKQKDIGVP